MLGAIAGDIIGSVYEFNNVKTKNFPLWTKESHYTDDTVCTLAIAQSLLENIPFNQTLLSWCQNYSSVGYGKKFKAWFTSSSDKPYRSWGNGAIMRISPVGYLSASRIEAKLTGMETVSVTHNSAEAITASEAYIDAFFDLKEGYSPSIIRSTIQSKYNYDMERSVDSIRSHYDKFYVRCSKSVPESIICALEATSFKDAIRNAVSLGGDSDTLACMTGALAEIRFGVPEDIKKETLSRLDTLMKSTLNQMYEKPHTVTRHKFHFHPLTGQPLSKQYIRSF